MQDAQANPHFALHCSRAATEASCLWTLMSVLSPPCWAAASEGEVIVKLLVEAGSGGTW